MGALTWILPEGASKLETPDMDPKVNPAAPVIDDPDRRRTQKVTEKEAGEEAQDQDQEDERPEAEEEIEDQGQEEERPKEGEDKEEEEKMKMRTRTFKLLTPLKAKTAEEVTEATMQMILRLRADGYHVMWEEFTVTKVMNFLETSKGGQFFVAFICLVLLEMTTTRPTEDVKPL